MAHALTLELRRGQSSGEMGKKESKKRKRSSSDSSSTESSTTEEEEEKSETGEGLFAERNGP